MSLGRGRAEFLQKRIIESIIRAHDIDALSDGGIRHIFGDLLNDGTIKDEVFRQSNLILDKRNRH